MAHSKHLSSSSFYVYYNEKRRRRDKLEKRRRRKERGFGWGRSEKGREKQSLSLSPPGALLP